MSHSTGAGQARGPGTAATLVPAVALATVLLLDVLRVWMPSVIFVHGRAGSTPAEEMGLFALVWVVLGLAAATAVRVVRPGTLLLLAAGLLAAARLSLQLWDAGGEVQLYAASIGWVAAMALLGALAACAPPARAVAAGLTLGLVADAALRAATGSVELTWIGGVAGTLAGVLLVAAFAAAVVSVHRSRLLAVGDDVTDGGPAWPWLAVGPVLVLYGVLAGTPARVATAVDLAPWAAAGLAVAALALGAAWALSSGAMPPAASAPAAAVLVIVGTILAAPAAGWSAVAGHVLLAVGLGGSLGVLAHTTGTSTATRRSLAAAGSLALLFVVGFLYYAAYDIALGVGNRVFLVATAVAVVVAVLGAGRRTARTERLATGRALPLGLAAAVLLAAVGAGAGTPDTEPGDGLPVRVMLYNIHMGFDTVGRFDTDALAAVIADQDADVVVLNEVDRGWFLNGSHDVLGLLAAELDMSYVFAPAADEIWGNAILSRFPIVASEAAALPRGGAPMARSFVSATIDLGGGEQLGVVGTHLHHVDGEGDIRRPQAETVAAEAERLAASGMPVVVMGDMNATPGDPELEPYLDAGLEDAVTPLGDVLTFPSWAPIEHIDHVFVSSDLTASDLAVPGTRASDHLGVAVTLDRAR